ncbi:protein-glutamate O-methyltransferase CheR [Roseateles asaccharophilus]|uniref:Chemotaxis protein methyltransferase CheR n=1 Tax=Roseateles asaccharophilus TaxID=582607 RepID=A0ABU2A9K3_9BURK|nr:protein-glutamate O-methyltransferase CheR [Roseateles asaccharophilus]MDR7333805.1 chemotaxis protein methyltransferase CheR [Roseateles asaccharophilus]
MPQQVFDLEVRLLMEAIYTRYNHDFREYSGASQKRRVLHAMHTLGCDSVSALQGLVLRDAQAFAQLLEMLTIPFTEMFREPDFFLALRQQVVPVLHTYPSLKVWVAGCASGEEVYSLAILLHEEGLLERSIIYATDINPAALDRARQGIFPLSELQQYTRNYQAAGGTAGFSQYYTAAYDAARFDRELVKRVTFADHSLATDHVFSETHLICCRNVLIYFNRKLQDRAIGLFAQSLCHRGFLGIGSKESLDFSIHADVFEPVALRQRLFRKR